VAPHTPPRPSQPRYRTASPRRDAAHPAPTPLSHRIAQRWRRTARPDQSRPTVRTPRMHSAPCVRRAASRCGGARWSPTLRPGAVPKDRVSRWEDEPCLWRMVRQPCWPDVTPTSQRVRPRRAAARRSAADRAPSPGSEYPDRPGAAASSTRHRDLAGPDPARAGDRRSSRPRRDLRRDSRDLVLSEKTVSTHVSNLLRKTGTTSRVELAQLVARVEPA
jgi:hypothetical protein